MTNNTAINPTLSLTNAHGTFEVEVDRLNLTIARTKNWSDLHLRTRAAELNGHGEDSDAYRADTRLEVQIMLTEGGNF